MRNEQGLQGTIKRSTCSLDPEIMVFTERILYGYLVDCAPS